LDNTRLLGNDVLYFFEAGELPAGIGCTHISLIFIISLISLIFFSDKNGVEIDS